MAPSYRPVRNSVTLAVGVSLAAILTACGSSHGATASGASQSVTSRSSAAATVASTPSPTVVSPQALGSMLQRMALKSTDLPAVYTVKLMQDGDQVNGQVTLDNCGYNFTTEAHRVARRQYAITLADDQYAMSNELVAYDSAPQASLALTQWHAAAAHCPHTPVHSTVAGVPAMIFAVSRNDSDSEALPSSHNAITVETATAQGETHHILGIVQVSGRYLDAFYSDSPTAITPADIAIGTKLASITGQRLAAAR